MFISSRSNLKSLFISYQPLPAFIFLDEFLDKHLSLYFSLDRKCLLGGNSFFLSGFRPVFNRCCFSPPLPTFLRWRQRAQENVIDLTCACTLASASDRKEMGVKMQSERQGVKEGGDRGEGKEEKVEVDAIKTLKG